MSYCVSRMVLKVSQAHSQHSQHHDDLRIETCWSDFKCFNVKKKLYMCIGWCAK